MEIRYVDDVAGLGEVESALRNTERFALDCEAAGYHRYSDRLCLVQLTAPAGTFLLDPLSVDIAPVLREALADPDRQVVMHGADYDVRLLDRDLGLEIRGLYDTQVTASLLGLPALGLSALLKEHFGVELSKKYQKADWAERPIPAEMRSYAAHDTLHLLELRDRLDARLREMGREEWAEEEFRALEQVRFDTTEDVDPVTRVKNTRDLHPREVDRLRAALEWRDGLARVRDRASFRIAGDPTLVEVARRNPGTLEELANVQGLNGGLARGEGQPLLEAFRALDSLPDEEVRGYPRLSAEERNGRGRPPPEVDERFNRIKAIRNARAEELGLDRAALISNAILQRMAESPPKSVDEMLEIRGIRTWQVDVMGNAVLRALL